MVEDKVRRDLWWRRIASIQNDEQFNSAALDLFRWQFENCQPLRALATARGRTPDRIISWQEISALPQAVFKATRVYCHDGQPATVEFETSGTSTGETGRQWLLDDSVYRPASIQGAIAAGFWAGGERVALAVLAPHASDAPRSSLSAMLTWWAESFGQDDQDDQGEQSDSAEVAPPSPFWVDRSLTLDVGGLNDWLEQAIARGEPVVLCGTAFSFVHWIDAARQTGRSFKLPEGSRVLETGGFKGRSRELDKADLYAEIAELLGLETNAIWNEYGMTELSSQAYARGLARYHALPPWARVRLVHPTTKEDVAPGEIGLVTWIDLANTDTCLAVETLDAGRRLMPEEVSTFRHGNAAAGEHGTACGEPFELIGRISTETMRGCSLTAEGFGVTL